VSRRFAQRQMRGTLRSLPSSLRDTTQGKQGTFAALSASKRNDDATIAPPALRVRSGVDVPSVIQYGTDSRFGLARRFGLGLFAFRDSISP